MKKLFYNHTEETLLGAGMILLFAIGACFAWGILTLISEFNAATSQPSSQTQDLRFRLDDARGIVGAKEQR